MGAHVWYSWVPTASNIGDAPSRGTRPTEIAGYASKEYENVLGRGPGQGCQSLAEEQIEKMGQWVKGKSHDTYGPIGPYLVTKDEISDINNLKMSLDVNGNRMQTGNTSTMIFNVNVIVSYVSKFMSLQPGDIITTGTPPGVGMGMKPQQFLKAGDTMKLSIENLGEQNSKVVAL